MEHRLELKKRDVAVLYLKDKITVYQLQALRSLLDGIGRKMGQRRRLILDLSALDFMDPLGLGVIVAFSKKFRQKSGEIRIVNMNGDLKQIFEESRLSRVYEVFSGVEEAERSFN